MRAVNSLFHGRPVFIKAAYIKAIEKLHIKAMHIPVYNTYNINKYCNCLGLGFELLVGQNKNFWAPLIVFLLF